MPEGANPVKLASMRALGGEPSHGRDFDEARETAEALAAEHGYRYIHSGNEPHLIAGVGTHTLEILEEQPEIDVVIVPIGGGSGAAGACIAAKFRPKFDRGDRRPVGGGAGGLPLVGLAHLLEDRMATRAEGLATRVAFEPRSRSSWEQLDDFVLVGEDDLERGSA